MAALEPQTPPVRGAEEEIAPVATGPLTVDDFAPVPSTKGAFYTPDGSIVYTHERDAMIRGHGSHNPFRKLRAFLARKGAEAR